MNTRSILIKIIAEVCKRKEIPYSRLMQKSKGNRTLSDTRMILMVIIKRYVNLTDTEISEILNRHRTGLIYARREVPKLRTIDPVFDRTFNEVDEIAKEVVRGVHNLSF